MQHLPTSDWTGDGRESPMSWALLTVGLLAHGCTAFGWCAYGGALPRRLLPGAPRVTAAAASLGAPPPSAQSTAQSIAKESVRFDRSNLLRRVEALEAALDVFTRASPPITHRCPTNHAEATGDSAERAAVDSEAGLFDSEGGLVDSEGGLIDASLGVLRALPVSVGAAMEPAMLPEDRLALAELARLFSFNRANTLGQVHVVTAPPPTLPPPLPPPLPSPLPPAPTPTPLPTTPPNHSAHP